MLTASLILAIMVLPFVTSISRDVFDTVPPMLKESAYGIGCTTWEVVSNIVIPYTRVGVIGGVMLGLGRALGETMAVTFVIGNAHKISASLIAPGTTISATIANEFTEAVGDLYTSSLIALGLILFMITFVVLAIARLMLMRLDVKAGRYVMSLYPARRRRNSLWMGLSVAAAAFGLTWLFLILAVLFWKGFAGVSFAVFTQMTPPPGSAGGLLNAIAGSLIMTVIGVVVGTPLGMLAGTYLAEYGRYPKLAFVVRFINDILLSAPSIVIGLFVYQIVVAPMGHFSGLAGGVALAVLVVPVVVRTTEDMLNLVPNSLREAGAALGMPRSLVIQRIGYRAAQGGPVDRRAAGGRARQRRNRAAAVHRAEQPVLEPEPQRADVEPAGGDLSVRAQPVQGMATARLDRRIDHHVGRADAEHRRARARVQEETTQMNMATTNPTQQRGREGVGARI